MVPNRAKQFTNTELFHRFIKTVNPWNQSVSKYYWPEDVTKYFWNSTLTLYTSTSILRFQSHVNDIKKSLTL